MEGTGPGIPNRTPAPHQRRGLARRRDTIAHPGRACSLTAACWLPTSKILAYLRGHIARANVRLHHFTAQFIAQFTAQFTARMEGVLDELQPPAARLQLVPCLVHRKGVGRIAEFEPTGLLVSARGGSRPQNCLDRCLHRCSPAVTRSAAEAIRSRIQPHLTCAAVPARGPQNFVQAARKPNSVLDDHSSRPHLAMGLKQPTRRFRNVLHDPGRDGPPRAVRTRVCGRTPCLFGLAPCGVYRATAVTSRAVGSYPTLSPLPLDHPCGPSSGGLLSVALAVQRA